jgi:hypothetical protein
MAEPLVPPPSEEEYNRGPRVQTDSSPMRQRFGPGFERIEAVVDFLNVPKDIVYNLGGASRQAFDSDLPTDERLRKGAEAGIGTLAYGLAGPVLGKVLGQKASQIIPEMFLGVSGPETKPLDDLTDKSRRDFMKGAAATAGVAALAPEAITEALEKVPAAVKRVKPSINPIDMFAKNIKVLRDEMNDAYDAADELSENLPGDITSRPFDEAIAEAEKLHRDLDATTEMEMRELISEIGLKEIKGAADDSLEELSQALSDFRMYSEEEYIDQMVPLAEEIEKRGLLKVKDENGIDKYPYARYVVEDVKDYLAGSKTSKDIYGMSELPKTDLEMTDRASIPVEDLVKGDQEDRFREIIRQELVKEFEIGKQKGLSQEEIDDAVALKRYSLEKKYGIDFSKADGGEMRKGVGSLSEIARRMNEGGVAASNTEYRRSLYGTESSGGALDAVNKRTEALGASQAMPETLEEFKEETGRDFTREQFKKNAGLQEAFQNWYEQKTLDYIANNGLDAYIGKMVKGVPVTLSGMMAVAHLGGNYGLKQFLETDGGYDPSDNKKNPEQGTRLSDYLQKHGGLNVYSDESLSEDAKEELVMSQPVAPRNPKYSDPDYSNPINYMRPVARPTDLAPVFQNEFNESLRPVARPRQEAKLQAKYTPEGIEQLLIGTTAEPLLPKQFQQGSLSGVGR